MEVVVRSKVRDLSLRIGLRPTHQVVGAVAVDEERILGQARRVAARHRPPGGERRGWRAQELANAGCRFGREQVIEVALEPGRVPDHLDREAIVDDDDVVEELDVGSVVLQPNRGAHIVVDRVVDQPRPW